MIALKRFRHCSTCQCDLEQRERAKLEIASLALLVGTNYVSVIGHRRTAAIAIKRHLVMAAYRKLHPDHSLPTMGLYFERDHSSIHHAINAVRLPLVEALVARYRNLVTAADLEGVRVA